MLIAERQTRLRELLAKRRILPLDVLSRELDVSPSTVRRDVEALELQGFVQRTHGGVIWIGDRAALGQTRTYAFHQRMSVQLDAKQTIAKAASRLVTTGQTILLSGGTTTFYLAEQLHGRSVQLITNSLPIANLFMDDDNVELIITGGLMYPRHGVMLGPTAENFLSTVHASRMFFSSAGILDGAIYNQNLLLVAAERRMMEQSQQVVLLADSDKFGQQALVRLCDLSEIDTVVSDSKLSPEHRRAVENAGCELIIADEE
ncbi:MAG TPA: DeoR/GlpR family DNA-binding transcription regulator [Tepidisphaeraceae bacterium]|jgi:DeoR/GlpR family transcriptional regulator of sugar metabolism|nr:DeoR/GlpR family DNA-binding transcription regulator [Tepidisphaeraceae bacterium]